MTIGTTTAIALAITAAVTAATTAMQVSAANSAAEQNARFQQENAEAQNRELSRQQRAVRDQAREEKSDVIRAAERELGSLRVAEGAAGLTSTAFLGLVNEVASLEGIDLSRIDRNERDKLDALQAQKEAAARGATNNIIAFNTEASISNQKAIGTAVGSGLQIGMKVYGLSQADNPIDTSPSTLSGSDFASNPFHDP